MLDLRNFSKYVQSRNVQLDQLPEGTIFELAKTNVDNFWMTMLTGWGFEERTKLHEFIALIESISKNKFSICDRRSELFGLKQTNEDPVVFLSKVNDMVKNADWDNITQTDATLLIFQQGVNCAQSKKICSEFIKTNPEGDIEQLADQLTGLQISKHPTPSKLNCTNCGKVGHFPSNCWGKCPTCDQFGHRPNSCLLTRQEKAELKEPEQENLRRCKNKETLERRQTKQTLT